MSESSSSGPTTIAGLTNTTTSMSATSVRTRTRGQRARAVSHPHSGTTDATIATGVGTGSSSNRAPLVSATNAPNLSPQPHLRAASSLPSLTSHRHTHSRPQQQALGSNTELRAQQRRRRPPALVQAPRRASLATQRSVPASQSSSASPTTMTSTPDRSGPADPLSSCITSQPSINSPKEPASTEWQQRLSAPSRTTSKAPYNGALMSRVDGKTGSASTLLHSIDEESKDRPAPSSRPTTQATESTTSLSESTASLVAGTTSSSQASGLSLSGLNPSSSTSTVPTSGSGSSNLCYPYGAWASGRRTSFPLAPEAYTRPVSQVDDCWISPPTSAPARPSSTVEGNSSSTASLNDHRWTDRYSSYRRASSSNTENNTPLPTIESWTDPTRISTLPSPGPPLDRWDRDPPIIAPDTLSAAFSAQYYETASKCQAWERYAAKLHASTIALTTDNRLLKHRVGHAERTAADAQRQALDLRAQLDAAHNAHVLIKRRLVELELRQGLDLHERSSQLNSPGTDALGFDALERATHELSLTDRTRTQSSLSFARSALGLDNMDQQPSKRGTWQTHSNPVVPTRPLTSAGSETDRSGGLPLDPPTISSVWPPRHENESQRAPLTAAAPCQPEALNEAVHRMLAKAYEDHRRLQALAMASDLSYSTHSHAPSSSIDSHEPVLSAEALAVAADAAAAAAAAAGPGPPRSSPPSFLGLHNNNEPSVTHQLGSKRKREDSSMKADRIPLPHLLPSHQSSQSFLRPTNSSTHTRSISLPTRNVGPLGPKQPNQHARSRSSVAMGNNVQSSMILASGSKTASQMSPTDSLPSQASTASDLSRTVGSIPIQTNDLFSPLESLRDLHATSSPHQQHLLSTAPPTDLSSSKAPKQQGSALRSSSHTGIPNGAHSVPSHQQQPSTESHLSPVAEVNFGNDTSYGLYPAAATQMSRQDAQSRWSDTSEDEENPDFTPEPHCYQSNSEQVPTPIETDPPRDVYERLQTLLPQSEMVRFEDLVRQYDQSDFGLYGTGGLLDRVRQLILSVEPSHGSEWLIDFERVCATSVA